MEKKTKVKDRELTFEEMKEEEMYRVAIIGSHGVSGKDYKPKYDDGGER